MPTSTLYASNDGSALTTVSLNSCDLVKATLYPYAYFLPTSRIKPNKGFVKTYDFL